ncbi:hypothetical protein Bbelb_028950 [Branchiostoma belcheri]|nr:hypothetical protein Bbelb_028950 [Branchiostoma belcheri]
MHEKRLCGDIFYPGENLINQTGQALPPPLTSVFPATPHICFPGSSAAVPRYLLPQGNTHRDYRRRVSADCFLPVSFLSNNFRGLLEVEDVTSWSNQRSGGRRHVVNMPKMGKDVCCHAKSWMADKYEEGRQEKALI